MISIRELPRAIELAAKPVDYSSLYSAESSLVHEGTQTTKHLFNAAMLLLKVATEFDSLQRGGQRLVFNGFLQRMLDNHVVIATDTDEPDEIKAAALYTAFVNNEPTAQLDRFAVAPELQRTGYGSAILEHIERHTASQGVERIWLYPDVVAIPFYLKHGYKLGDGLKLQKDLQRSGGSV
jgi:GNAT superfamily N-acetyltransferase